jgi:putative peptide zinc metalloprotease protein
VAILFWAPWPRTVKAPAVLQPPAHAVFYAPFDGRVGQVHVAAGTRVTRGQVLAELAAPDLAFENQMVQQQIDILRWQMKVRGFDTDRLGRILILETAMRTHLDRLKALEARLEKGILRAPMDGGRNGLERV